MSGSTVGGVIGAAIGFYVTGGNPQGAQWGWMIGSAVGGYVDPEVIKAPSIGDAQRQTSQAGIPIPKIYGKPQRIKCNMIDGELQARKEIVEEEQGKGGPTVESEEFRLTSAFGICEGPIAGIQRILRNGEVVYDRSTDGDFINRYSDLTEGEALAHALGIRALTLATAGRLRVYLGTEDQTPDPSLEALHGVGNTPHYKGLAYFVVIDDNVTATRGAASLWEVEPLTEGVEGTIETSGYVAATYAGFNNNHFPLNAPESQFTLTGYRGHSSGVVSYSADTIEEIIEYFADFYGPYAPPDKYLGYSSNVDTAPWNSYTSTPISMDVVEAQADALNNAFVWLVYNQQQPTEYFSIPANDSACPFIPYPGENTSSTIFGTSDGHVIWKETDALASDPPGAKLLAYCLSDPTFGGSAPGIAGWEPLWIKVERKRGEPVYQDITPSPDYPGFGVDSNGNFVQIPEYTFVPGTFKVLRAASTPSHGNGWQYTHYEVGPALPFGDPNYNNQAWWEAEYAEAAALGNVPGGWTYGVDYPVAVSGAWLEETDPFDTIEATDVTLQSVVESLAARANLPPERLDASELGDVIIPGYLVATGGTVADSIRPLQQPFVFDMPEIDGQIVCRERGGASAVTVTDDDLLEQSDDDVRTTPQETEFPKKIHFVVPDPDANYTPTPQTAERYTPDIKAIGEVSVQVPIPFTADPAKQKAEIMLNVAWARAEGTIELSLPEEFSQYVPSDCFQYNNKRWLIEEASYADGVVHWKAVYDRVSNYGSNAVGVPVTPVGTPPRNSGLLGPSSVTFLNIPQVNDVDDKVGLYVAVTCTYSNWPGAQVQAKLTTDTTWRDVGTATARSIGGVLTSSLASAPGEVIDTTNSFDVTVYAGELSSTDFDGLLNEQNGAVIGDTPTQEVIQFQTATDNGGGEYTLSTLARGRLDSVARLHSSGERFVLLNAPLFVELPVAWIGRRIQMRAVTTGLTADNAPQIEFDWNPAESLTEWAPYGFEGERDGSNNISMRWIERGRMGSTLASYQSVYFDGYRVTLTKGTTTVKTYTTTTNTFAYTAAQQIVDFGSATGTLSVRVEAINRFTGPSAALTGSIA